MIETVEVWGLPSCVVEQVVYPSDGLRIVGWVVTPRGTGPFPVLVWNHGARIAPGEVDLSATPTWQPAAACCSELRPEGWILFMPEGRGYAGSDGPRLVEARARGPAAVLAFLHHRARDVNAGVALLRSRPSVRAEQIAVAGVSHGGVVALLAAAAGDYRGVVAQATGASAVDPSLGIEDLERAIDRIEAPILLQHAANDEHIPADVSRRLAEHARISRACLAYRVYPGLDGLDGHLLFSEPSCRPIWQPDYFGHLTKALGGGPSAAQAAERNTANAPGGETPA
jgi:dienelactone hydrolase